MDLAPKDKNKNVLLKVLGINCDYLVKFTVDEPHLGLRPSHRGAFHHRYVWLSSAFIDFGGQKVSVDVNVKPFLTVGV